MSRALRRLLEDVHALPTEPTPGAVKGVTERVIDAWKMCVGSDTAAVIAVAASFVRKCRLIQERFAARSSDRRENAVEAVTNPSVYYVVGVIEQALPELRSAGASTHVLTLEMRLLMAGRNAARCSTSAQLSLQWDDALAQKLVHGHPQSGYDVGTPGAYLAELRRLAGGGGDVSEDVGFIVVSTKDPLLLLPIRCPARSTACQHAQPFELTTFLQTCAASVGRAGPDGAAFSCPVCSASVRLADVFADRFLARVFEACNNADELRVGPDAVTVTAVRDPCSSDDGSDDELSEMPEKKTREEVCVEVVDG